jgi:hypothetical protein
MNTFCQVPTEFKNINCFRLLHSLIEKQKQNKTKKTTTEDRTLNRSKIQINHVWLIRKLNQKKKKSSRSKMKESTYCIEDRTLNRSECQFLFFRVKILLSTSCVEMKLKRWGKEQKKKKRHEIKKKKKKVVIKLRKTYKEKSAEHFDIMAVFSQ